MISDKNSLNYVYTPYLKVETPLNENQLESINMILQTTYGINEPYNFISLIQKEDKIYIKMLSKDNNLYNFRKELFNNSKNE